MEYTTAMIWSLAPVLCESKCYINAEGYCIKFNGEYFSEYAKGKVYGVAITKIDDKWKAFDEKA